MSNIMFASDMYLYFGLTKTSPAVQKELGLRHVPGVYLHTTDGKIVQYTGELDSFGEFNKPRNFIRLFL